jgi:hypothetical protein
MSRIIRLQSENFKRLVAIDIVPDGNMVVLSGRNHQGKTSVLDAIFTVLQHRKVAKELSQPIRDGEDVAFVKLWIGDDLDHIQYIATRRWTKDDSGSLTVEAPDGAKYGSPQKLLDDLMGEISFDPVRFLELDAKAQVNAIVDAIGPSLSFDPVELAAERLGVYDRRTDVGREVKKLEGQLAALPSADPDLPDEEESAVSLLEEAERRRQSNAQLAEFRTARDAAVDAVNAADDEVSRLRESLEYAVLKADQARKDLSDSEKRVVGKRELDLAPILERLNSVETTNKRIRQEQERRRVERVLADYKEQIAQLTIELGNIDKRKAKGIQDAQFPVPELSFSDLGVTFNGLPLTQASTEEQYRASFGVAIASNPKLRVCRIDRGESLDSDSLNLLAKLADEYDMQVWITRVTDGAGIGFVLEEGKVR